MRTARSILLSDDLGILTSLIWLGQTGSLRRKLPIISYNIDLSLLHYCNSGGAMSRMGVVQEKYDEGR